MSFLPEMLPSPSSFYAAEFGQLPRARRGWVTVRCCFHNEKTPSLSLHLSSGGFHCFGCLKSGGDLVDFIKERDSVGFRQAAISLGAWEERRTTTKEKKDRERKIRERERIARAAEHLQLEERRLRLAARDELHTAERLKREVSAHLRNLPDNSSDADACWNVLMLLEDEIAESDTTYRLLSFGAIDQRARYVLNEAARPAIIQEEQFGRL
jgi:DNA primase